MYSQLPVVLAVVVPICYAPSNSLTVVPAAAVPFNTSVLSLVMPSPDAPVSLEKEAIAGDPGGFPGEPPGVPEVPDDVTETDQALDSALLLMYVSVALAAKEWSPLASCDVVYDQAPP